MGESNKHEASVPETVSWDQIVKMLPEVITVLQNLVQLLQALHKQQQQS